MRISETVTFGGGGVLDRAGHLRAKAADPQGLLSAASARAVVFWRGKVLVDATSDTTRDLARLRPDQAIIGQCDGGLFLGLEGGEPRFAFDLAGWTPPDLPESFGAFADHSEQAHPDLPGHQRFAELRATMAMMSSADAELAATAKALLGWHDTHQFCARCGAATESAMAGWQRDCPACGGRHFPRTDPVVIMLVTHGDDLLLGRSPHWPDGMYSLLAGFVEPGETIEAAVRREVAEEAGVTLGEVGYLASQPWPFPSSLMIGCHGQALDRQLTLDPVELEDAIWVSRTDLAEIFAGRSDRIRPARKGSIAQFLMRNWLADRLDALPSAGVAAAPK